jgi:hypothetical protein
MPAACVEDTRKLCKTCEDRRSTGLAHAPEAKTQQDENYQWNDREVVKLTATANQFT